MAKRLVTYIVENEKNKVLSISAPIGESDINVDEYLSNGWEVKNMTACGIDSRINFSVCYILIEKQ